MINQCPFTKGVGKIRSHDTFRGLLLAKFLSRLNKRVAKNLTFPPKKESKLLKHLLDISKKDFYIKVNFYFEAYFRVYEIESSV